MTKQQSKRSHQRKAPSASSSSSKPQVEEKAAQTQPADGLRRLNRDQPFGTLSQPWYGDRNEFDRPVFYEQGGVQGGAYFDRDGVQVLANKPLRKAAAPAAPEKPRILDRTRDFAQLSPYPWNGDRNELPRPAFNLQDGALFDQWDEEIILGREPERKPAPLPEPDAPAPNGKTIPPADWTAVNSPAELFQRADEFPDRHLRARAEVVFGKCGKLLPEPATRTAIMEQLMVILGFSLAHSRAQQAHAESKRNA